MSMLSLEDMSTHYSRPSSQPVNSMYRDAELYQPLVPKEHIGGEELCSSPRAAFNVACTVVGAGILSLPKALGQSGWFGTILLGVMAVLSVYAAILIKRCLHAPSPVPLITYGDLGRAAFGKIGAFFVNVNLHVGLIGSATIYLVLAGSNLKTLLAPDDNLFAVWDINSKLATLFIALVVWFHVFFKTLKEVGVLSALNIMIAVVLVAIIIMEIFWTPEGREFKHGKSHDLIIFDLSLGGAFASFAFAYSCHSVLPSVYESMQHKHHYNFVIYVSFIFIFLFYTTLAVLGYWAYGSEAQAPIYDNLCFADSLSNCVTHEKVGKIIALIAISLHVMFSYAVVINVTEVALERTMRVEERPFSTLWRIGLRSLILLGTYGLAIAIPDFGDFLDLVGSLTASATVFIFPSLFYMKLYWDTIRPWEIAVNIIIILFGFVGGGFGCYFAIKEIVADVF